MFRRHFVFWLLESDSQRGLVMNPGKPALVRMLFTGFSAMSVHGLLSIASVVHAQQATPVPNSPAPAAAPAQTPPANPAAAADDLEDALKDVSTKYRFREVYTKKDGEALPGEIAQTRNAFIEKLKMTVDRPKGAPMVTERTRQQIYSERPASITGFTKVDAVVRRFETLRFNPAPQGLNMEKNPPLDGLTLYVVRGPAGEQVVSLDSNRSITDFEYQVATSVPTLLNFAEILPQSPVRIGDTWAINRTAARILVGRGQVESTSLKGELKDVKPLASDPSQMVATSDIQGQVVTNMGTCFIRIQYLFQFPKSVASVEKLAAFGNRGADKVLVAHGAIGVLTQAQMEVSDLPGTEGRLKQTFERTLTYERRTGGRQTPIPLPAETPKPTKTNSWLVFEDAENRFSMAHPPVFQPQETEKDSILFVTPSDPPSFIRLDLDAAGTKPEGFRKDLEAEWKAEGIKVFALQEGFLDDKEWGDRRVYRIEAAIQMPEAKAQQRAHFDAWIIQFPQSNQTYIAESTTWEQRSTEFRDMVEQILQSIKLTTPTAKPAEGEVKPAAPPATAPPAAETPNPAVPPAAAEPSPLVPKP